MGFVGADYSQQRNDIHFTGLSRNLLAAGVLVPSPAHEAAEQRPGAGEEKGSMVDGGQGTQGGLSVILLLLIGPPPL